MSTVGQRELLAPLCLIAFVQGAPRYACRGHWKYSEHNSGDKTRALKQGMMQGLLTGRTRLV